MQNDLIGEDTEGPDNGDEETIVEEVEEANEDEEDKEEDEEDEEEEEANEDEEEEEYEEDEEDEENNENLWNTRHHWKSTAKKYNKNDWHYTSIKPGTKHTQLPPNFAQFNPPLSVNWQ